MMSILKLLGGRPIHGRMFDPRPRPAIRAERRSVLLAEAGTLLDSSLDYELTLANIARLAVPRIADWCSVDVLDEDGGVRNVATAHVDTAKAELARELRRRYPEAPGAVHRVLLTADPELHPRISDATLAEAARDPEELRLMRAVGMRSGMTVPLVARGQTLGAMTFIAAESGREFDEQDLAQVEELAGRCAQALENARLYREAREAEQRQKERAMQQAAVVELGRRALAGADPPALMEQAASLVSETLAVEYSEVLELLPDGDALLLRAGTGWGEGRVGTATVLAGVESPAGLALRSGEPVIVQDLGAELRFSGVSLLLEHGIASGMSVVIPGPGRRPFGVLGAHSSSGRRFTPDDAVFLEAMANLLASAIERRHADEASRQQAMHDHLTGLPNRSLFLDRVTQALARSDRRPGSPALLFFDLDRFKVVNDSLGHAAGDELLVAVAARLSETVRREDTLSRFGGDEFTVLYEEVPDEQAATALAGRIAKALEAPFRIGGRDVFVGASIGIVFARDRAETAETLLRDADTAMYHAKERGRGRYEIFHERMRPQAMERLTTESALRQAVEVDGFSLVYQPVIDLRTSAVVGTEALVRWDHPRRGPLEPRDFIPLAEETGLIHPIGAFVLEEACRQTERWRADRPDGAPLRVFVNLSAAQLSQPDLPELTRKVLSDTGLAPASLCLEITESVLMTDVHAALNSLMALKGLGVLLAIDDFGTGYSSLSYLKRLPVDYLKIDSSFIEGLGGHVDDSTLIAAMMSMAKALGLTVIAEGVESDEQLAELGQLECELAQGHYLAPPQPAEELQALLCPDRGGPPAAAHPVSPERPADRRRRLAGRR
ncbi:MAG: EAL domain-containing protein [Actinomycetota bacterium]|nr:EAL domain-containing protein [Actinomycetota bacterium]